MLTELVLGRERRVRTSVGTRRAASDKMRALTQGSAAAPASRQDRAAGLHAWNARTSLVASAIVYLL